MSEPLRVLLVDDHALYRRSLRALFATMPDVEVVGEASDGTAAVAFALEHQPDVVLMDLQMPGTHGVEATRALTAAAPHIGVLVLTMFEDASSVRAALQAGARGYVLKGSNRSELLRALRGVAAGDTTLGGQVGSQLAALVAPPPSAAELFPELDDRDRTILTLVAAGKDNHAIAGSLGLSEKTVRNRLSGILDRIGARDRAEAAVIAAARGIGPSPPPAWDDGA
jgi:DNA-binding NarL/FixJ family response regulator